MFNVSNKRRPIWLFNLGVKRLDSQALSQVYMQCYNHYFHNHLKKIIGMMKFVIIYDFYDVFLFEYSNIIVESDNVSGNTSKLVK